MRAGGKGREILDKRKAWRRLTGKRGLVRSGAQPFRGATLNRPLHRFGCSRFTFERPINGLTLLFLEQTRLSMNRLSG